jgi:hypothetical protein
MFLIASTARTARSSRVVPKAIADVEVRDRAQDRQPQRDDDPVDQCGSKTHGGSMLRDANPLVVPRVS